MSSHNKYDTVQVPVLLLTEPGYVPETSHHEFQFVAEENDEYDTSYDKRQSQRKSKQGIQTKNKI